MKPDSRASDQSDEGIVDTFVFVQATLTSRCDAGQLDDGIGPLEAAHSESRRLTTACENVERRQY
jgi:hypothetical protein